MRISSIRRAELFVFPNSILIIIFMNRFASVFHIINLVKVHKTNRYEGVP